MKRVFLTLVIGLMTMVGYSQTLKKGDKWYPGKELTKVDSNGRTWIGHYHTEYLIFNSKWKKNYVESVPSTWKIDDFLCENCELIDILERNVISWSPAYQVRPLDYGHEKP